MYTSPKLSEFHKKLQNFSLRRFGASSYFVLGYHNVVFYSRISSSILFAEADQKAK